MLISTLY